MTEPEDAAQQQAAQDTEAVSSIGRAARSGLVWGLLGNFATRVGTFAIGLVLARLLTPAEFGVYAVALAAMLFAMTVNDAGVISACVQWPGRFEDVAGTAAILAFVSSVVVYGILWLTAPAFAALSGAPEATPVVRLLTLVVVVDGITAVRSAALLRRFEQRKLTAANFVGVVANAGLAVPMAVAGAGAYSFAGGQLFGWIVTSVLIFRAGRLGATTRFDRTVARRLVVFGVPLATSLGIESALFNVDYIVVGNALGPVALGFYLIAFNISTWIPALVGTAVRYVTIPAFSRLAEQGSDELNLAVQRSLPVLVTAILPFAVVSAVLATPLIHVVYGPVWTPAADALRFLSVLMVTRMLTAFASDVLIATGRTRDIVYLNVGWAAALIPALWFATNWDGIRGTAMAHGVVAVVVALPLTLLTLRRAGIRLLPVFRAIIRPIGAALVSAVFTVATSTWLQGNTLISLMVSSVVSFLVYGLIALRLSDIRSWRGIRSIDEVRGETDDEGP